MKRHRISAILGIFIILIPYLGFPMSWNNLFYAVSGVVIVIFAFWFMSEEKHKNDGV